MLFITKTRLLIASVVCFALLEVVAAYALIRQDRFVANLVQHSQHTEHFAASISSGAYTKPQSADDLRVSAFMVKQTATLCLSHDSRFWRLFVLLFSSGKVFSECLQDQAEIDAFLQQERPANHSQSSSNERQDDVSALGDYFHLRSAKALKASDDIQAGFAITAMVLILLNSLVLFACFNTAYRWTFGYRKALKKADYRLREMEHRLTLFYKANSAGIWDIPDAQEDGVYWSEQIRCLLGYQHDEFNFTNRSINRLIHPDHVDDVNALRKTVSSSDISAVAELLIKTKSEGYRWFRAKAIGSFDPITQKRRITGALTDIHAEKEARQKLSESISFMKLVLNNIPDMVFVKNRAHEVVEANQAFYNEFPNAKTGQKSGMEEHEHSEEEDELAFTEGYSERSHWIKLPSGITRRYQSRKIRFENSQQEPFLLVLAHDITDTERLIEQIMQSNRELEQFAFIASHDLQEPLRKIASFSKLLHSNIEDLLDEESAEYLQVIQRSADRLQTLIQDLLVYARAHKDNEQKGEEIDLNLLTEEVIEDFEYPLREAGGNIHLSPLPTLVTHGSLVRLLVSNLISNAIKYQEVGSSPRIQVRAEDKGANWEFCVEDNGIGIDPRFSDRIFVPFKRLHRREEYLGSGIGLAICKKVLEQLGGNIWFESEIGQGSRFFFTLPKNAY